MGQSKGSLQKPGFVPPMLATSAKKLPEGSNWQHEVKWDGYRIEAVKDDSKVSLFSRRGNNFTKRFASVADGVSKLKVSSAVLDGEVVAVDQNGQPSFQMLQNRSRLPSGWRLAYYAFDLLHLNGVDLKALPLVQRRQQLKEILSGQNRVRFSESLEGSIDAITKAVTKHQLEGIVAKRKNSIYEPGKRSGAWQKVPLKPKQEFIIGGYRPAGKTFELLLVGNFENEKLVFAGKVRQGLNPINRKAIFQMLKPLKTDECPFSNLPSSRTGHWGEGVTVEEMSDYVWLEPVVVAEIKFTEWTRGQILRHAEFVSLREENEK